MSRKVLHLDSNHPVIAEGLEQLGFQNEHDYTGTYEEILGKIEEYEGLIIRFKNSDRSASISSSPKFKVHRENRCWIREY
jgi:D-3-phosphoglycerate dehydrogenase